MRVTLIHADTYRRVFDVCSGSGRTYTVVDDLEGDIMTCTCPDFRYRRAKKDEDCKHIAQVLVKN